MTLDTKLPTDALEAAAPTQARIAPTDPAPLRRVPRRTRPYERGAISDVDRRNPQVRFWLLIAQVLVFAALVVVALGPLVWLFKASVSSSQEVLRDPIGVLLDTEFLFGNFARAWTDVRIGEYLVNTVWVVLGSWIATLVTCTTGGYVLSVLRPRWGALLSWAVLATLFIPNVVSLVPLYLTVLEMPVLGWGLINTYWAVWLPHAASAFLVLIVKRFFDQIPPDLYEAARVDGAGPVRIFFLIVLPMSKPILGVVSLLSIISAWKDYLWPLLVLPDTDLQPISVALPKVADSIPLNIQMSALFLAVIIPVVLFLLFQKQFLEGASGAGAVKG